MTHASAARSTAECGFTLLELLIVLAVLAAVASLSLPLIARPSESVRLEAASRELVGALRVTRMSAIARGRALVLVIDSDKRTFRSDAVPLQTLDSEIQVRAIVAQSEQQTPTQGGFRFYPDGSSSGGDVRLEVGAIRLDLCVDWLTGAATRKAGAADRTRMNAGAPC